MKAFAIRDDEDSICKDYAYLLYYETSHDFYIELPDNADPWETPLLLSTFVRRGEKTVNSHWSKIWVQQRIVPTDRQNIGQVLRDNGLCEYDEFELLIRANGRCAQDSFYLEPVDASLLKDKFGDRYEKRVNAVIPVSGNRIIAFFANNDVREVDISSIAGDSRVFKPVLSDRQIFETVTVQTGGYGISWGTGAEITDTVLHRMGRPPVSSTEVFTIFAKTNIVNTAEAASILNCSRQNINDLVQKGQLHPIKTTSRSKLFLRSDIMQRLWN